MLNDPIADVVLPDSPQGLQAPAMPVKTVKALRDGQVVIEHNSRTYTVTGQQMQ